MTSTFSALWIYATDLSNEPVEPRIDTATALQAIIEVTITLVNESTYWGLWFDWGFHFNLWMYFGGQCLPD